MSGLQMLLPKREGAEGATCPNCKEGHIRVQYWRASRRLGPRKTFLGMMGFTGAFTAVVGTLIAAAIFGAFFPGLLATVVPLAVFLTGVILIGAGFQITKKARARGMVVAGCSECHSAFEVPAELTREEVQPPPPSPPA